MIFLHETSIPDSLYLHYPVCRHHCSYCDFNVYGLSALGSSLEEFDKAWLSGLDKHLNQFSKNRGHALQSLYLGGGTPSLLSSKNFEGLVNLLSQYFDLSRLVEFTMEANPESLTKQNMRVYRDAGVNRVSLGVQSFSEKELRRLERLSTLNHIYKSIEGLVEFFPNFSLDLMIGTPDQKLLSVEKNITELLKIKPPHVSVYILGIDKDHVWNHSSMSSKLPQEKELNQMYKLASVMMSESDYCHYEVSNYAQAGFKSVHNSTYWDRSKSYVGLGPGAHGYDSTRNLRYWNETKFEEWKASGSGVQSYEELNTEQQWIENVYLSLRSHRQLAVSDFDSETIQELVFAGYIKTNSSKFYVAEAAWILIDYIAQRLLQSKL